MAQKERKPPGVLRRLSGCPVAADGLDILRDKHNSLGNQLARTFFAMPVTNLHPLSGFEIFIVFEKMRNLAEQNGRKIRVRSYVVPTLS